MIDFIWFQYDLMVRDNRVLDYLNRLGTATKNLFVQRTAMVTSTLCVVPLLHFNSYYDDASEDNLLEKGVTEERTSKGSILTRKYQNRSLFTNIASSAYNNQIFQQEDTVMEIMLNYKWREFARWRFSVMMIIHVIYYLSYSFAVSFPQEAYGYQPGLPITHPLHVVATVFMFLTVSIFLLQEVRQCLKFSMLEYITSAYNWIDLAAYSLTITTFLQMRYQSIYMLEVGTIAILLLWTHAILRLRIIRPFGKTLEIIIQLFKEVFPMLFIMIVVIIAFTHSFIFLLRQQPEEYFQEQYDGSTNNETILAMKGTSGGNSFTNFLGGFPAVWFFIHGIWDPIMEGEAADNPMVVVLSIAFSFVMVFIFFNMVM
ncbi:hypothetical protein BDB01DRAFT_264163 [Pilobolus umbonatus]|nr:hypothetical protein BDB01DRAFT_264163 [Pilobolus umbonatus]